MKKMTVTGACRLFSLSRTAYYDWNRRLKLSACFTERQKQDQALKIIILDLVKNLTYIPGKRALRDLIFKTQHINTGIERISRLMKELGLFASSSRRKDAYKGQIANFHPCCALTNYTMQDFYIGCRCLILTDITYIPYGADLDHFAYLCTFIDPYTKEVLGWAVRENMDTELVKEAYRNMMENHGDEFPKDCQFYIHSDQGSQYLASDVKELFGEQAIQSMSRRGNSQDNAPQESYFGRLKARISDHFPLMKTADQVRIMIGRYQEEYNREIPQDVLGGLTPALYYQYLITGVYPKEEYFGIPAQELNSLETVIKKMQERTDKALNKRRSRDKVIRTEKKIDNNGAFSQTEKDIEKLEKRISQLGRKLSGLESTLILAREILDKARSAKTWIQEQSAEKIEELNRKTGWDLIPELSYVSKFHLCFD